MTPSSSTSSSKPPAGRRQSRNDLVAAAGLSVKIARMRSINLGLIVVMLGAARVPAGAAAADPAGPPSPEYWLARAQSAADSVNLDQRSSLPPMGVLDVAMAMHEVSATPQRRKWTAELATRVEAGLNAVQDPVRR